MNKQMKKVQQGFTLIELMIVVAIIGILAAVAIPAYSNYTAKAQASEAFTILDGLKTPLAQQIAENGALWATTPTGIVTSGKYVASVAFGGATGAWTMKATYQASGVSTLIQSQTVTFTFNETTGAWACSTSLAANIKPSSC